MCIRYIKKMRRLDLIAIEATHLHNQITIRLAIMAMLQHSTIEKTDTV